MFELLIALRLFDEQCMVHVIEQDARAVGHAARDERRLGGRHNAVLAARDGEDGCLNGGQVRSKVGDLTHLIKPQTHGLALESAYMLHDLWSHLPVAAVPLPTLFVV